MSSLFVYHLVDLINKAEPKVQKYLGWALFPQAGVAIGMATLASQGFPTNPEYGAMILAAALAATLVYELVGSIITKIALTKAGEIVIEKKKPKEIINKP